MKVYEIKDVLNNKNYQNAEVYVEVDEVDLPISSVICDGSVILKIKGDTVLDYVYDEIKKEYAYYINQNEFDKAHIVDDMLSIINHISDNFHIYQRKSEGDITEYYRLDKRVRNLEKLFNKKYLNDLEE